MATLSDGHEQGQGGVCQALLAEKFLVQVNQVRDLTVYYVRHLTSLTRGHPYMTSALRRRGVSPKEDVVKDVA